MLFYLDVSFQGESAGKFNAAIILEKFNLIKKEDLNYLNLENELLKDEIFKSISKVENNSKIYKISQSILGFIYDDYLQLIPKVGQMNFLKFLLPTENLKNPSIYIAYKLHELGSKEQDLYSIFKLGDYNYYGLLTERNYLKAANYYEEVIGNKGSKFLLGQAYFNLG